MRADHLLFVVSFATLVACGGTNASMPSSGGMPSSSRNESCGDLYHASPRKHGAGEPQVNLLARGFLPSSGQAHPGFAYYAYLLFADGSPASAAARREASKAYLAMLTGVSAAMEKSGVARENLAVLYVPLTDEQSAGTLIQDPHPQTLLAAYNYVRARGMVSRLKRAGKSIPDVAIIGSARPLDPSAAIIPDMVDVVDLTNSGTVQERMEKLRDSLESGEHHLSQGGQPVVLQRLRQFFAWVDSAADDVSGVMTF